MVLHNVKLEIDFSFRGIDDSELCAMSVVSYAYLTDTSNSHQDLAIFHKLV